MTASSLPARIGYAIIAFPIGAILGYFIMLQLLLRIGSIFKDPHPSMQGFGYFMMSLAAAATLGLSLSLVALTLPWYRPSAKTGRTMRIVLSALVVFFAFIVLSGQGNALIFSMAVSVWLALVLSLTFIRHGVLDHTHRSNPQSLE
jgi:hypothetical protein